MGRIVINRDVYKKISAILVIAALIEPAFFTNGSFVLIDLLYDILKIVCALYITFVFFCRMKTSMSFWFVFLFESCLLFSTLFMGGNVISFFKTSVYIIIIIMFLECLIETDAPIIVSAIGKVFGIYTYISLGSFLLYPKGLYTSTTLLWGNNWFLGNKNQATPILLLGIICSLYDSLMRKGKISLYSLSVIVCSVWYLIGVSSITGILAAVLTLFIIGITFRWIVVDKIFSCKNIVLGNMVLFILLVFVRIQNILDLLGNIILQLGKTLTFSSRTYIWDQVLPLLQTSILWGHGVTSAEEYRNTFHYTWAVNLHSYYLQVLFEGGLLAFVLLFGYMIVSAIYYDQYSRKKESLIIKYGLMSYLIASQMEVYGYISTIFILIFLLCHIDKIEKQYAPLREEYEINKKRKIKFIWGKPVHKIREIEY